MTKDEALTLALEALERASHSLGSFVSDHGWGQEDMNTLDSVMAAEHRIKEALARPEQRLKQVAHVYLLDAKGWPKVGWDDGRGIKVGDKLYTLTSAEELLAELISAPENVSIPWPEERNFCPRCGKRTADPTTIHTCIPPQSERLWVGLTDKDLLTILGGELDSSDEAFLRFGRAVVAHTKQKNT